MGLLTLLVVAVIAGVGWHQLAATTPVATNAPGGGRREPLPPRRPPAESAAAPAADVPPPPPPQTGPPPLRQGQDYYVWVKLIEVHPKNPAGGRWETRGSAAPDLFYDLYSNKTRVYTSPVRDDRLIAEWDLLRLDLKDALLSGQVDLASAVNAPIVHLADKGGGTLKLEVYDQDNFTFNDAAGTLDLPVESLHEGVNTLRPNPDAKGGLARVVIDMVPRDTSLPDLLQIASDR